MSRCVLIPRTRGAVLKSKAKPYWRTWPKAPRIPTARLLSWINHLGTATVARSKDAERAKFEGEAAAFKASTKSCQAKNVQLIGAGREILKRYHSLTIGDAFVATEPLVGVGRVNAQNFLQESTDKLLDQKATP